eukprot:856406-Pyramimonas_sp.AAC.1
MTTDFGGMAGGPAHFEVSASVASLRVTTSRATFRRRSPRYLHLIAFPSKSSARFTSMFPPQVFTYLEVFPYGNFSNWDNMVKR